MFSNCGRKKWNIKNLTNVKVELGVLALSLGDLGEASWRVSLTLNSVVMQWKFTWALSPQALMNTKIYGVLVCRGNH